MAEIEIFAISKRCLDRRIRSIEVLSDEVSARPKSRNCKKQLCPGSLRRTMLVLGLAGFISIYQKLMSQSTS